MSRLDLKLALALEKKRVGHVLLTLAALLGLFGLFGLLGPDGPRHLSRLHSEFVGLREWMFSWRAKQRIGS